MRKLPRVSPALVVACSALVVALGGTTYAAISLPARSVGTPAAQARCRHVGQGQERHAEARRLRQGTKCRTDSRGCPGPAGRKGDTGAAGAVGRGRRSDRPAGPEQRLRRHQRRPDRRRRRPATRRLATLAIPQAGKYVIWAKVWLIRPSAGQATHGHVQARRRRRHGSPVVERAGRHSARPSRTSSRTSSPRPGRSTTTATPAARAWRTTRRSRRSRSPRSRRASASGRCAASGEASQKSSTFVASPPPCLREIAHISTGSSPPLRCERAVPGRDPDARKGADCGRRRRSASSGCRG